MGMRGIEKILDALEPFYVERMITQEECEGYLKAIEVALVPHGVRLHKDAVHNLGIEGLDSRIELAQEVFNGAAQINLRRYDRRKDLTLTVFTEYDKDRRTHIPRRLEVQRNGNEITHNYLWY